MNNHLGAAFEHLAWHCCRQEQNKAEYGLFAITRPGSDMIAVWIDFLVAVIIHASAGTIASSL